MFVRYSEFKVVSNQVCKSHLQQVVMFDSFVICHKFTLFLSHIQLYVLIGTLKFLLLTPNFSISVSKECIRILY